MNKLPEIVEYRLFMSSFLLRAWLRKVAVLPVWEALFKTAIYIIILNYIPVRSSGRFLSTQLMISLLLANYFFNI